ncbi:MAG TPA: VWA domain-containing protein [Acidobacteriaceae bacterium]|nr:VWA domain-containing protein [Acidobacteriaceae bacterium]
MSWIRRVRWYAYEYPQGLKPRVFYSSRSGAAEAAPFQSQARLKVAAQIALAAGLALAPVWVARAQTTESGPQPVVPSAPPKEKSGSAQPAQQQKPAPIERRSAKPGVGSIDPVAGPMGSSSQGGGQQPVNGGGPVETSRPIETIRVKSRLVNVALNVVDAHGAPVGGFEKQDFKLFEDGQEQKIAVFEREATSPLSIVLAIDTSETVMTSERLEREAAKHFVRAILREQDELDLMQFADDVREIVPFTNQAKRIEQGLGELQQGDETALYNAVYLASQRLAGTSQSAGRRRVLVVISDGGDYVEHGLKYEEAIQEAQRADAMIYTIIMVPIEADAGRNTGGEHALIQMAEDTGGKYYYVVDPKDLEPAFQHVSDDLRTQYLLGYYAPERNDAGFRRIRVALTDGKGRDGYQLRYRTGYFPDTR